MPRGTSKRKVMVVKSKEGHIIRQVRVYNNALNKDKIKSLRKYDPKLRKHVGGEEVGIKEEKHSS